MVDNALMCALLKAIKPGARLILIGDADQLPSVGAGRVLNDLIDSGCFATVRLTEIFRQAQESLIVTNAHAVNDGQMPDLTVKNNDFFFMPRASDHAVAETIVELYGTRLPRAYGKDTEGGIQVISPSRRGEAGTENLNRLLQSSLNPPMRGKRELKFRETVFREGDRVMQTKNNYDILWEGDDSEGSGVFNGDIGRIEDINLAEKYMYIRFDDRVAFYPFDKLKNLDLSYAITVHKSQGSEYPVVIVPIFHCAPMLQTRNLIYTAVTRAKRMVILVGNPALVYKMVDNTKEILRYTTLSQRMKECFGVRNI